MLGERNAESKRDGKGVTMARANQEDAARDKRSEEKSQADQAKSGTGPQRQAGDDNDGSHQQGGSDTSTQFSDWAII